MIAGRGPPARGPRVPLPSRLSARGKVAPLSRLSRAPRDGRESGGSRVMPVTLRVRAHYGGGAGPGTTGQIRRFPPLGARIKASHRAQAANRGRRLADRGSPFRAGSRRAARSHLLWRRETGSFGANRSSPNKSTSRDSPQSFNRQIGAGESWAAPVARHGITHTTAALGRRRSLCGFATH